MPSNQVVQVGGDMPLEAAGFSCLTFMRVRFVSVSGLVVLSLDSLSHVLPHRPVLRDDCWNYVELCAGMSASSFGFCHVGFRHRCSVEWQSALVDLHRRIHPSVPVIHADIGECDTACKVHAVCPEPATLMSGFSCQPYSRGGLEKGSEDARSSTLPATLKLMHWLQSPVLVLECVVPASSNCFVIAHVQALESQLGYHVSQCCLKLESVWCGCRYRWWLIATHPALGRVLIPPYPQSSSLLVRDLMPFVKRWPEDVENQLRLTAIESEKFQANGQSLRNYVVKSDQKLPTALHSWGGQAVACACGCRDHGFSDSLLGSKGIYAQLLQVVLPDGSFMFRHLHAVEVAILSGVPPCLDWSDNERLNLCAIGQMATPLQSVWIGASIVRHMRLLFSCEPPLDPNQALHDLKVLIHAQSKHFFGDIPKQLQAPSERCEILVHDERGHPFALTHRPGATVKDLIFAEADLLHVPVFDLAVRPLESQGTLAHDTVLDLFPAVALVFTEDKSVLPVEPCPTIMDLDLDDPIEDVGSVTHDPTPAVGSVTSPVDPVVPSGLDSTASSLLQLSAKQLQALLPPLVGDVTLCQAMHNQTIATKARFDLLEQQELLWGDDEILWHLNHAASCSQQEVKIIDPLLVTGWLQVGSVDLLRTWLKSFPHATRFVSAVLMEGHWTPFVWACRGATLDVVCWEHDDVQIDSFNGLHGLLCQSLDLSTFRVACTRRSFGRDLCGAGVVSFTCASLNGLPLPCTEADLDEMNRKFKAEFRAAHVLEPVMLRPWCWGAGVGDLQQTVANLLQFHGVPQAVSSQRAKLVMQSLGRDQVQAAVGGVSPWKSLKSLANQHTPIVQLVLPDELAAVMQAKKEKGHQKSRKDNAKFAPAKPAEVDPSRLVLAAQSFCTEDGVGVSQIPLSQVGPLVSGIALVNYVDAMPFLQDGKVLTPKGLALLAINGPDEVVSDLPWTSVRFAAKCAANQQPVLLNGFLIQLGQQVISPNRTLAGPCVPSVSLCPIGPWCTKINGQRIGRTFVNIRCALCLTLWVPCSHVVSMHAHVTSGTPRQKTALVKSCLMCFVASSLLTQADL